MLSQKLVDQIHFLIFVFNWKLLLSIIWFINQIISLLLIYRVLLWIFVGQFFIIHWLYLFNHLLIQIILFYFEIEIEKLYSYFTLNFTLSWIYLVNSIKYFFFDTEKFIQISLCLTIELNYRFINSITFVSLNLSVYLTYIIVVHHNIRW